MKLDDLVILMENKSYMLNMGAGKLAKQYKTTKDNIYRAKEIVRSKNIVNKRPRILLFDLETAPLKGYFWRIWKENISFDAILADWFLLGYSCKWLGEDKVYSNILTPDEISLEYDFRLINELWELLDEADIVIGHNSKRFDTPRIKTRFLVYNLPPTSYYQQIDTLEIAKKEFSFTSNKLDSLAKFLGLGEKLHHDIELWMNVMNGSKEDIMRMRKYNEQDVMLLEKIYLKLRPFIKSHPNYSLYTDNIAEICPTCGSNHLEKDGHYYTQSGKYETFRCLDCGAISRKRKTILSKEKNILLSIPGR